MKTECFILLVLLVEGVFGETDEVSGIKGHNVTLETNLTKQNYVVIQWYFNDIHIAQFDKHDRVRCFYDGEGGIFRDRLEVNYETGSLTISNITSEHAGQYGAVIERMKSRSMKTSEKCNSTKITEKPEDRSYSKTFTLTVSESDKKMESVKNSIDLSAKAVPGIVVVVVVVVVLLVFVAAAAGVIYSCRRRSRKEKRRNNRELL